MDEKRFTLRMDASLFEDIVELAQLHRRSTAKEIECAIAAYVCNQKRYAIIDEYGNDPTHEQALEEIHRLKELFDKYRRFE